MDEEYEFERAIHFVTARSFYSFKVPICEMKRLGRKRMSSKEIYTRLHSDVFRGRV